MSWWDTSNFSNLASQALKNAQKKIDKVLDIEEQEKRRKAAKQKASQNAKESEKEEKETEGGDFWSTWMGSGSKPSSSESKSSTPSSWSLPWGSASDETKSSVKDDGDSESQSEDSSFSKLTSFGTKLISSKGGKSKSSGSDLGSEEGTWVGDAESVLTAQAPVEETQDISFGNKEGKGSDTKYKVENLQSPELRAVEDEDVAKEVGNVQCPELKAVDEIVTKDVENLQTVELTGDNTLQSENLCSEDSKMKHSVDNQEMFVASGDGWDISNSVLNLVEMETDEKSCDEINSDINDENTKTIDHESHECHILDNEPNFVSDDMCVRNDNVPDETCDTGQDSLLSDQPSSSSTTTGSVTVTKEEDNVAQTFSGAEEGEDEKLKSIRSVEEVEDKNMLDESCLDQQRMTSDSTESTDFKDDATMHGDVEEKESGVVQSENEVLNSKDITTLMKDSFSEREGTTVQSGDESDTQGLIQGYVNISSTLKETHSLSDLELGTSATSSEFEVTLGPASSTGSSDTGRLDSSADTVVDSSKNLEGETEDRYSLFEDSKIEEGAEEVHTHIGDTVSPASSFVKCMLEEAMEESNKEDSGSDNHSSGSKSESSKLDSEEKSVYSGQESSDDIETTTSSDIEIISGPGLGGQEKQFYPGFGLPQLKIAIQQRSSGGNRHGHQRSDSQSSSSTHSKGGDHEELSPEQGEGHSWRDEELQHPDLEAVQEEGADNPYHPERLLKLAKVVVAQQMTGGKKLAEMAEVLQARETKLVSMSKDNHRLMEDGTILRSQLQQSEEARESETADLKALTDEFTVRIGESERKLQAAIREKESLKEQLTTTQSELQKRSQNSDSEMLLEEKTEQVQELLAEGEKLSKQQLQNSNIIKKLRVKEKENESILTSQKTKIEEQKAELDKLKTVLDSKGDMESKQADAINQLNAAVQKQDHGYAKILSDLEDAQEKNRGLQTALDNAYKEIAELNRSNASQDSKAQEAALSKETSLREELKMNLEREQQRFRKEREAFIMQADDLRLDMTKLEKEHNRREDLLREEIAHLQERLQQDEARNQDVSQSITAATRPLLRQIENLQATYAAQSNAWEKVEKNLTDRLAEAQIALAIAQDKERTASESEMELKAKATSLDSANARLKQEKAQLMAHRESDQLRLEELQDARNSFIAQLETSKQNLSQELTQVKMQQVHLESQLALETNKLENEKKKSSALDEQLRMMERERPKSRGTPSPSPSMSVSRQDSLMGSFYERNSPGMNLSFSEDLMDNGSEVRSTSTKVSVYESLQHSGTTIVMENLQSQLKLKEGEIIHLQSEIGQLERTRESMARELVNLSNQNEELRETKKSFEQLGEKHKELNNRYSAILLMYGEKEEQVQELRLDLQDVKEMYKTQIDVLLTK